MKLTHRSLRLAAVLAVAISPCTTLAQVNSKPSGSGPCRQGVLALINMLDAGEQGTADYRSTAQSVVQTCGRSSGRTLSSPQVNQVQCRQLALSMLDAIEDGKMNSQAFVLTRDNFARSCSP